MWHPSEARTQLPRPGIELRVHMDATAPEAQLAKAVLEILDETCVTSFDKIVVLCIGSDRFIGDSLGPLVGTLLEDLRPSRYVVKGTLCNPVHACNLSDSIRQLATAHPDCYVLAVDASLGRPDSVGTVCVASGTLAPGAGVNKQLPPVGNMHITGVVNIGGFMEYFVLQNTRLGFVMRMARVISGGIDLALSRRGRLQRD